VALAVDVIAHVGVAALVSRNDAAAVIDTRKRASRSAATITGAPTARATLMATIIRSGVRFSALLRGEAQAHSSTSASGVPLAALGGFTRSRAARVTAMSRGSTRRETRAARTPCPQNAIGTCVS
jgi:hypothetical protein